MGAGQSANNGARPQGTGQEVKTSYYELLEVDKSATDEEIKKAYRRKALTLHPDRNYGQEEQATEHFAAIQTAYEVLSDPQERAWYNSHEEAILRDLDPTAAQDGGTAYESSVGLTSADDITRLVRRFHGGIDFSDSPSGFFGFLREFFEQLAKEEEQAARRDGVESAPDYPGFGHKDDTHEEGVKQFYSAWAGFSTVKSFSWRDKYRASDAEDRRMRRLIEKKNAQFRREGAQEFNDAVRSLVAFVRKRDPRYKANSQTEAERQKVLQDASKAQAARMRAANEEKMKSEEAVPEWARAREAVEGEVKGVEEGTFEESSSEEEHFECMACRKTFKSERQYEAHEKSNKHKKAVQALRKKLQKEGHHVGLDEDDEETLEGSGAEKPDEKDLKGESILPEPPFNDEGMKSPDSNALADNNEDELFSKLRSTRLGEGDNSAYAEMNPQGRQDGVDDASSSSDTEVGETNSILSGDTLASDSKPTSQPKKGKAAQKREKRAARAAEEDAQDLKNQCAVCATAFPSKTRLFQHIKDFGHAAPVPQGRYKQPTTAGKKKKKG